MHTTLLVETNLGVVSHPIHASALSTNEYGLPHSLVLPKQQSPSHPKDSTTTPWMVVDQLPPTSIYRSPTRPETCVDLHVPHPNTIILEAAVTDAYTLSVHASKGASVLLPTQQPTWLRGTGQATRQPDQYLLTVCPNEDATSEEDDDDDQFLQLQLETETIWIALHRGPAPPLATQWTASGDLLDVSDSLDFYLLSSSSSSVTEMPIALLNRSKPVRILRASVVLDRPLLDGITVELIPDENDTTEPMAFQEERTIAKLRVSADWDTLQQRSQPDDVLRGTVVLRATHQDLDYEEWSRVLKVHPSMDDHLIVELPVTIKLSLGKIAFALQGTTHDSPVLWMTNPWERGVLAIESAFYPVHVPDLKLLMEETEYEYSKDFPSLDHHLRMFSSIKEDIQPAALEIVPHESTDPRMLPKEICKRFVVEGGAEDRNEPLLSDELDDLGLVLVRYMFRVDGLQEPVRNSTVIFPRICYLRLTTFPDTGIHETPLFVYPGMVEPTTGHPSSVDREMGDPLASIQASHDIIATGLESSLTWFQETSLGSALHSVLDPSWDGKVRAESDRALFGRYLYSLSKGFVDHASPIVNPIILDAGAVSYDEAETVSMYLTNYNPVPVDVSVQVGEVEGVSLYLARDASSGREDGSSILDYIPRYGRNPKGYFGLLRRGEPIASGGQFHGHALKGLRNFLTTDARAGSFLAQFPHRDAISVSERATRRFPLLRQLFSRFSVSQFHRDVRPLRDVHGSQCHPTERPSPFGSFERKINAKHVTGPLAVTGDRRSVRRLSTCWDQRSSNYAAIDSGSEVFTIPPGGAVRLEVRVRAPPLSVLEKDMTSFLVSGLLLSTDHGEVMPLLVSFTALRGKLQIARIPSVSNVPESAFDPDVDLVGVPVGLFESIGPRETDDKHVTIPPRSRAITEVARSVVLPKTESSDRQGVPLYMKSTFSRDVHVRQIQSCNPWFEFSMVNESEAYNVDPFFGVHTGMIRSTLPCSGSKSDTAGFPSFYRCALDWLSMRARLQPRTCGMTRSQMNQPNVGGAQMAMRSALARAIKSLDRARVVTEWSSVVRPTPDGATSSVLVDAISEAWDAWFQAADLGLATMSTSLKAIVEHPESSAISSKSPTASDGGPASQIHVVSLPDVSVVASLETPSLLDVDRLSSSTPGFESLMRSDDLHGVLEFPATPVGATTTAFIPLRNPTGVPVRVRLAVSPDRQLNHRDGDIDFGFDESVRERYIGEFESPYIQRGVSGASDVNNMDHHSWWVGRGAFYQFDPRGNVIASHENTTIIGTTGSVLSMITPSQTATSSFRIGCGRRCAVESNGYILQGVTSVDPQVISPIGASSALGARLIGRHRLPLAEANRVSARHQPAPAGSGFYSNNNGAGPAAFGVPYTSLREVEIPPYETAEIGPIVFRPPGRSRFLIGTSSHLDAVPFESTILLENSLTGLERVLMRGRGMWSEVSFLSPDGEFGDLEHRNGFATLVFPHRSPSLVVKEVVLWNTGDLDLVFSSVFLTIATKPKGYRSLASADKRCAIGEFTVANCSTLGTEAVFSIAPNATASIFVSHTGSCRHNPRPVSLVLGRKAPNGISAGGDQYEVVVLAFDRDTLSYCQSWAGFNRTVSTKRFLVALLLILCCELVILKVRRVFRAQRYYAPHSDKKEEWSASFRLLARTDPSSTDILLLGREQTRQVVVSRYRTLGILQPQCIGAAGAFQRDRTTRMAGRNGGTGRNSRSTSGGTERSRVMLCDTIFHSFAPPMPNDGLLSCDIDLSVAEARGLVQVPFMEPDSVFIATNALLRRREEQTKENDCDESISLDDGNSSSENVRFNSSSLEHLDAEASQQDSFGEETHNEETSPLEVKDASPHLGIGVKVTESRSGTEAARADRGDRPSSTVNSRRNGSKTSKRSDRQSSSRSAQQSVSGTGKIQKSRESVKAPKLPNGTGRESSEKTTSSSSAKDTGTKPAVHMRPPPGLAPPPGFALESQTSRSLSAKKEKKEPRVQVPSLSNERPVSLSRSFSAASSVSGDLPSSPLADLNNLSGHPGDESGFDVLDFLDGILNDTATRSSDEDAAQQLLPPLQVSENPWATPPEDPGRSRAAAYGIAVEDEQDSMADSRSSLEFTLLTPAVILAEENGDDDNVEDVVASVFGRLMEDK